MMLAGVVARRIAWTSIAVLAVAGGAFGIARLLRNPVAEISGRAAQQRDRPVAERAQVVRPPRPSEAYAGSAVCAECHPGIHESFRSHPMGHSLAHVTAAPPIEDYSEHSGFDRPSSRLDLRLAYEVERTAEGVFHHELMLDSGGAVIYDRPVPVHYAVGSGTRGRSYITNRDGLLFMSPMTWYSQKKRWDFSPGYELNNRGFERPILDGCITCHAGRLDSIPDQPHRFASEPFLEESIGCERCHGPAAGHVALHRRGLAPGETDPIVNPVDLSPSRRDAVCFQCHLSGEERIPRYGRTHYDFRPGDEITDIWTVFVTGTRVSSDQTTVAVSQVEQMRASTCYQRSEGRLGCISCHDPHSVPAATRRVEFYRSRCVECHTPGSECSLPLPERLRVTAEDSCIECHMPPIPANDVPHTSQTDHRILRRPAQTGTGPGVADNGGQPETMLRIFDEEGSGIPAAELERARGLMLASAAKSGSELLAHEALRRLIPWFKAAPDDVEVAENLGSMYALTKDNLNAYQVWKQALELNPRSEQALRGLMVLCHDNGRLEEAAEFGQRLTAVNPWNHMYVGRLAHVLGQLGRLDEGLAAGQRATELKPSDAKTHGWMSDAYRLQGDSERARHHRLMLEKLTTRK